MDEIDEKYMREALDLAKIAATGGEIPVGAILVQNGNVIGRGFNLRERGKDATLHAEMIAIRNACHNLGGWRLPNSVLYVTLEPCPMCAGAILNARIERLVYGAKDPKSGACGSVLDVLKSGACNHETAVEGGVLEEDCAAVLKEFFAEKRD